jgi:hypothetical protein
VSRKTPSFRAICIKKRTFYQDRLETNIGKALKKGRKRSVCVVSFGALMTLEELLTTVLAEN